MITLQQGVQGDVAPKRLNQNATCLPAKNPLPRGAALKLSNSGIQILVRDARFLLNLEGIECHRSGSPVLVLVKVGVEPLRIRHDPRLAFIIHGGEPPSLCATRHLMKLLYTFCPSRCIRRILDISTVEAETLLWMFIAGRLCVTHGILIFSQ